MRKELAAARRKARDDICERLNIVGTMGEHDASDVIQVDYRGLHVNEMCSKYEELVESDLVSCEKHYNHYWERAT